MLAEEERTHGAALDLLFDGIVMCGEFVNNRGHNRLRLDLRSLPFNVFLKASDVSLLVAGLFEQHCAVQRLLIPSHVRVSSQCE